MPAAPNVQYFPSSVNSDILLKTYVRAGQSLLDERTRTCPMPSPSGNLSNPYTYDGSCPYDTRYRVAYQHHLQFGNDFSSTADLNFWSDPWVTRDFLPRVNISRKISRRISSPSINTTPISPSRWRSPRRSIPSSSRRNGCPQFEGDVKQQKIFGTGCRVHQCQNSVDNLEMRFANLELFSESPGNTSTIPFPNDAPQPPTAYQYYHPNATYGYNLAQQNDYNAYRYDTYQEFAYPKQYFNFLSLTPRMGGRLTQYSDNNQDINDTVNNNGQASDMIHNPVTRLAGDVGLKGDFKISRTWLNVSAPNLGINGIRHVVEPYFDAQYAPSPTVTPNNIRGFDNRLYSTQLQPLDWTEYNSIDSIDRQAVVRFGVWNKIQTKRDGVNYDLLTLQTYADADFDHNFSAATPNSTLSNLFNKLTFAPLLNSNLNPTVRSTSAVTATIKSTTR